MLAYLIGALVVVAMLAGAGYKGYEFGSDRVRVQWDKANAEAAQKVEADRKEQEARAKKTAKVLQAKLETQKLVNQQIKGDLDRELKKNPLPAECVVPPSLLTITNNALAGPKSDTGGSLPNPGGTAPPTH